MERMQEFRGGQFTAEHASKVQESLSEKDNKSLMRMSGQILDQQAAAQRLLQAINMTVPMHGRRLQFRRILQINPDADMIVAFKTSSGIVTRWLITLRVVAALTFVYRWLMVRPVAA